MFQKHIVNTICKNEYGLSKTRQNKTEKHKFQDVSFKKKLMRNMGNFLVYLETFKYYLA